MDAGYDHLRAAIIAQTKKDFMTAVPGGIAEKRIECDVCSTYWAVAILEGYITGTEVITAWREEKRKNSQY